MWLMEGGKGEAFSGECNLLGCGDVVLGHELRRVCVSEEQEPEVRGEGRKGVGGGEGAGGVGVGGSGGGAVGAVGWVLKLDMEWTDALADDEGFRRKAERDLSNTLSDLTPGMYPPPHIACMYPPPHMTHMTLSDLTPAVNPRRIRVEGLLYG